MKEAMARAQEGGTAEWLGWCGETWAQAGGNAGGSVGGEASRLCW